MDKPTLTVSKRAVLGKKVKRLRSAGKLPGILYGRNVDPVAVEFDEAAFSKLYRAAGSNTIVKLALDEQDRNVLLHEPELDPVTERPLHVDLYQVSMTEKIKAEVPLHFVGESAAVREQDGTLVTNYDTLEVECLPANLPQALEVDLSVLESFDNSIKVSDIKVPADVEVLTDAEETVAYVEEPRSEEEMEALDEAPVEGEAPALVGGEEEGAEPAEGETGESPEASADTEPSAS